jgi:hypothetical protein
VRKKLEVRWLVIQEVRDDVPLRLCRIHFLPRIWQTRDQCPKKHP